MKLALILLLIAAPLSAQDRDIAIVPAQQTNNVYVQFDSLRAILEDFIAAQPEAMSDSVRQANFDRNMEGLRELLAEDECNTCGGATTTQKIGLAILPVLVWIAWELRGIKNNSEGVPGEPGRDGSDGEDGEDGEHHNHGHHDDESGESG